MRVLTLCFSLVTAAFLVAPDPAAAQQVAEVQVAPVSVSMAVGERREVLASAFDARGDNLATAKFIWTSSDSSVIRVAEDPAVPGIAVLTGVNQGNALVEARFGRSRASAAVQVFGSGSMGASAQPLGASSASVMQIDPGSVFLLPSEDVQLRPGFLRDDGSPAPPAAVTWRSLRPDVANVSTQGVVVGLMPGQGVIEAATIFGLSARVTVEVGHAPFQFASQVLAVSPNASETVRVVVPNQNFRPINSRRLLWRSMNPSIARVSPIGVVTGVRAGETEVVATGFGQENRLRVTVHREVVILGVDPNPSRGPVAVPLGGARKFTAMARAADDTPIPEAPITWVLPDTNIAVFDLSAGELRGMRLGKTKLTARAPGENLSVTWDVTVIAGGLVLGLDALGMGIGERHRIKASFTDDKGVPVSEAAGVTWTSSAPSIVDVDDDGNVEALSFGTTQVVATTPWGIADTATIYVQGDVLVTSTRGDDPEIYSFDRARPETFNRVTSRPGTEHGARFSPTGTRIVYVSDEGGNNDIWVADADGTNAVRLTNTTASEGAPAWTPDGTRLVYESDAGGKVQVWIMSADGSNQRQLTMGDRTNQQPSVSPNGKTIAFTSARDGNFDIYIMNVDGSNQRNFTASADNETAPAWMGDSAIAYVFEKRKGGASTRAVKRMNFSREIASLTPTGLAISDFALSASGDLLAAVVPAQGPSGLQSRLYLIPIGGGTPVEVPRAGENEQLLSPSFRR